MRINERNSVFDMQKGLARNPDLLLENRIRELKEEVAAHIDDGMKAQRALNLVLGASCVSVQIKQGIRKEFA